MASPSPRAVTRLMEKIETSVNRVMTYRVRNVPRTATTPTSRGSPAATRPANTRTNSSRVMGMAMDSARARSPSIVVVTDALTGRGPAERHRHRTVDGLGLVRSAPRRPRSVGAGRRPPGPAPGPCPRRWSAAVARCRATSRTAPRPRRGAPVTEASTLGPSRGRGRHESTLPSSASSTRTRCWVGPVPKSSATASAARVDSEAGSLKPPASRRENTAVPSHGGQDDEEAREGQDEPAAPDGDVADASEHGVLLGVGPGRREARCGRCELHGVDACEFTAVNGQVLANRRTLTLVNPQPLHF